MLVLKQCAGDGPLIDIDVNQFSTEVNVQSASVNADNSDKQKKHRHSNDAGHKAQEKHRADKSRALDAVHHGLNRHEKRKAAAIAKKEHKTRKPTP